MAGYTILIMKNILRIMLFTLFLSISPYSLFGQVFVSPSNEWLTDDCRYSLGQINCDTYKYWFNDTVIIDSVAYLRLNSNNLYPLFAVGEYYREENGIVFMKKNITEREVKIYNFNLNIGEEFEIENPDFNILTKIKVTSIDSITLNSGEKRKRLNIIFPPSTFINTFWIEGIGAESSPMNPAYMFTLDSWVNLNCFHENNTVEFQIGDCQLSSVKNTEQLGRSITSYPNPAKEIVRFARVDAQPLSGTRIVVTDTNGRTLWQSPASTNNTDHIEWQTGNTPSGVCFYTILDADGLIQTGRITIIK
ncbi:MAG: hypothetical protein RIR11_1414 [Bacteroidota bacterium]|jgi:hypothetical protein